MSPSPLRVLFVCAENACRSQMAEAFAKLDFPKLLDAHSSESRPSGSVNPKAIASMRLVGDDLARHRSKGLAEVPQLEWD